MKSTLTVGELYALERELSGQTDPKTNATIYKGLLVQELSGSQKYSLLDLYEEVLMPNKKIVDKLQEELLKKLAIIEGDRYSFPTKVDKKDENGEVVLDAEGKPEQIANPNIEEFNTAYAEIVDAEKEFNHEGLTIAMLDFKAKEVYPIFSKLIRTIKKQQAEPVK